ncbi:MAG TPA: ABC transporter ATP-binding protein [Thermoanaerobaculia bacterium]|nr:ABC transporter ATP-binding protein [Thermoanaerobaculia bacterium]
MLTETGVGGEGETGRVGDEPPPPLTRPPSHPLAPVVLSAEGLTKSFGKRQAVVDVSFDLFAGEVFGFLGPNGAGKTTTIRMLVGLARPDRGRVRIGGLDLARDFARAMARVGSIVESPDLYGYLSGRENLLHFARMLPDGAEARIAELAHLVALEERLDDKVQTYSLGMRQRLGIAQALLGAPDLLILDEPANGLDPAGIREIRRLVRLLASERGIAVFVSSHLLSEVEQMCDRVTIIHRGRALATGPVRELLDRSASGGTRWRVRPAARAAELLAPFAAEPPLAEDEETVSARIPKDRIPGAVAALSREGIEIYSVEPRGSSLEEVFLEVTGGETV